MQHCDPKDQILSKLPTLTVDLSVLNVTKLGWTGFLLRSVWVGTIVDLETRDCRLRVLLIDVTSHEETTGNGDESYG